MAAKVRARSNQKAPASAKKLIGTVTNITAARGFGFILVPGVDDAADSEFFFHKTGLAEGISLGDFNVGSRVSFSPIKTSKGMRAISVEPLEEAE